MFRFAAPTLAAGNSVLLKHSPNVTGCALAIEQIFATAGLPANIFRTLLVAEVDVAVATDRASPAVSGPAGRLPRPLASTSRRPSSNWAGPTPS